MDDFISRQAVSDWLKQYGQDVLHKKYKFSLMYIWKNLMDLPSAQPKTGKWIDTISANPEIKRFRCSECGYHITLTKENYCPNCGAKMEVEQDG